jgi:hypothetical protein
LRKYNPIKKFVTRLAQELKDGNDLTVLTYAHFSLAYNMMVHIELARKSAKWFEKTYGCSHIVWWMRSEEKGLVNGFIKPEELKGTRYEYLLKLTENENE